MKKLGLLTVLVLLTAFVSGQSLPGAFNCSTIIVGKDASATGHVLIGHNEDDGGMQVVNLYKTRADKLPGDKIVLKNGAVIDQADATLGYIWLEMPGQDFADNFLNENGVLITSNSCPSIEREGEIVDGGIGYNLRKIVAERAKSARHGVEIAGSLISELGYNASGRTYTIADTKEAWMLSVVRGKHWLAMRIPDKHVVYLPNFYIIEEVDFDDKENYLCSPGLKDYAITRKWYEPESEEFIFRDVYSNPRSAESMSNTGRMWVGVNKLSDGYFAIDDQMPVSFVPEKPLDIDDLIDILGNHYEGTELDDSEHYTLHNPHENKIMNICAGHQQMSFIAELRDGRPVETGCRLWIAPRRGCVHAYMPVYYGIEDFPPSFGYYDDPDRVYERHYHVPDDMYKGENGKSWWSFMAVTDYVDEDYGNRIEERRDYKNKLQREYYELAKAFDHDIVELWDKDKSKALSDISQFNKMIFEKALESNDNYLKGK
ncbi:MAG: C69 family dipeptidase [Bacteroidales bacterium]|nr:C69 family dipeptidase [Bacteroidales bacterium]